jgi:hypothetical protein
MPILLSKKHSEDKMEEKNLLRRHLPQGWTNEPQGKISTEVRTAGGSDRGRTTERGGCDQPSVGPIANWTNREREWPAEEPTFL